jgi:hypothetical protein
MSADVASALPLLPDGQALNGVYRALSDGYNALEAARWSYAKWAEEFSELSPGDDRNELAPSLRLLGQLSVFLRDVEVLAGQTTEEVEKLRGCCRELDYLRGKRIPAEGKSHYDDYD